MTLKPGIYIATVYSDWFIGSETSMPMFEVIEVARNRVKYRYINMDEFGIFSRGMASFVECKPIPASELMQELF